MVETIEVLGANDNDQDEDDEDDDSMPNKVTFLNAQRSESLLPQKKIRKGKKMGATQTTMKNKASAESSDNNIQVTEDFEFMNELAELSKAKLVNNLPQRKQN